MPTTIQTVYNQVALIFFENNGFSTGTGMLTDGMFFTALGDVMEDFLNRTECVKKIVNIPIQAGVAVYPYSTLAFDDIIADVQSAWQNETFIYRDSGFYLESADPNWTLTTGQPAKWREDENPPRRLQLVPTPNIDGYTVDAGGPAPGYGTISSTGTSFGPTPVPDFDIVMASGFGYGTISSAATGDVYLETLNPGYGLISTMASSTGNLSFIGAATPSVISTYVLDYLELIPDSFTPYVAYGVASKLFSADGESKDNQRAKYCQQRYEEGLLLVGAIMNETAFEEGEQP